jgi:aspartate-semialdehyde dehydrogenase
MSNVVYRIGIVGATSLAGKELADELQESLLAASAIVLLDDDDEAAGLMTAAGGEPAFVQRLESTSFHKMDFVFFAGDPAGTARHWKHARRAGASIIDLTYVLGAEKGVLVRSPLVVAGHSAGHSAGHPAGPDLNTPAVVAAHPAAVMLALVASRLKAKLPLTQVAATVMEPASEHGRAAMDELHHQTVNLLSFQSIPREYYDAQVSFNLLPALGEASKIKLQEVGQRILDHYAILAAGDLPKLGLQIVQAPVFHGYVASVLVELENSATVEQVEAALAGEMIEVVDQESDPPSNVGATGQGKIMVRVSTAEGDGTNAESKRFWLWLAADNLKLAALNAIACALELRRLRPSGKVQ